LSRPLSRLEPRALGGISALAVLGLVDRFLSLDATELVVGDGSAVQSDRDQSQLMQKGHLCVQSERCLNLESRLGNLTVDHRVVACGGLSLRMFSMRPLSRLQPRVLGGISALVVLGLVDSFLSLDATELVVGDGPAVESDRDQRAYAEGASLSAIRTLSQFGKQTRKSYCRPSYLVACGGLSLRMFSMRRLSRLEPRALGFLFG
jgi:hypothetical protein